MKDIIKPEHMKMYIRYRMLSVFCSTVAYLIWLPHGENTWYSAILVPVGMILACNIGAYLYKKIIFEEKSRLWLSLTILLEQFAYGIFISMSGGLSSPYLWCFLGYIFLIAVMDRYSVILLLSVVWMAFCIILGHRFFGSDWGADRLYMNTVIGIIIVSAGFYTIQKYSMQLEEKRWESEALNESLIKEKETTEQLLHHIKALYDTIKIFTVVDQNQSMDELTEVLAQSIAPNGCLLLKFKMGMQQEIEDISSHGLKEVTVRGILKKVKEIDLRRIPEILTVERNSFVVKEVGESIFVSGLFFLALDSTQQASLCRQMIPFYQGIIETVFRDIDMQKKLEEGIIKEEQHRIASEIHDTVIQKLFGISCSLKALENGVETLPQEEISHHIAKVEKAARHTMKELREAIYGIRFESESDESFEDKLHFYIEEMECLSSIPIVLATQGDFSCLSVVQKTVIYRILCEAVSNAVRHGEPHFIDTKVEINERGIYMRIQDNGSGFKIHAASPEGMGMENMHRMASLMKGSCSIRSTEGKGATVEVFMPQ